MRCKFVECQVGGLIMRQRNIAIIDKVRGGRYYSVFGMIYLYRVDTGYERV